MTDIIIEEKTKTLKETTVECNDVSLGAFDQMFSKEIRRPTRYDYAVYIKLA